MDSHNIVPLSESGNDSDVGRYIKTASTDTKDRWGQITIAAGDTMIVDPDTGECVQATPENIAEFKSNGMSFYIKPNEDMSSRLGAMQRCKTKFDAAIETNVEALKGVAIPGYNLPWWVKLVPAPFTVRFRNWSDKTTRQSQSNFIKYLEERKVIPPSSQIRKDVWREIENSNLFRVYELRGWGVVFHVYALFVTHIAIEEESGIRRLAIKPVDPSVYESVMNFVEGYENHLEEPSCRCFSIGSFGGWDKNQNAVDVPGSIQVLSSPNDDESTTWSVKHNSLEHMQPVYRTLVYRLYPETWKDWYARICSVLKNELLKNRPFDRSMTVSRMAQEAHVPPDCVAEVFEDLRTNDKKWMSSKNKTTGEMALKPSDDKPDAGSFVPLHRKWLWVSFSVSLMLVQILIIRYINRGMDKKDILCISLGVLVLLLFLIFKNNLQRKIVD